ncbi:unnamed protein product [Taenia asiatica]|uniref:C2H2-type domain-containing protein n=1 Tax=Taenia asiatica TaxID=60517 RepID=A0A0R3WHF4_TAEAS|nr:unnamed protein product [Taenia asiatica]
MACHTMAHMGKVCPSRLANETHPMRSVSIKDEALLSASNPKLLEKSRSPENLEPSHSNVPKVSQECPAKEESSEEYRCTICGFTFDCLDVMLFHTEQEHPTEEDVINRLRLRLWRAAFDPNGYRLENADEKETVSSSTASYCQFHQ